MTIIFLKTFFSHINDLQISFARDTLWILWLFLTCSGHFGLYYFHMTISCYFFYYYFMFFCDPEFLQRNAVPQPAARVTGTKQLYPKPSRVRLVSHLVQHPHTHTHVHLHTHSLHIYSTQNTRTNINAHVSSLPHSHTQNHSYCTQILCCQPCTGARSVQFQSHKNQTKFRHKVTWIWVTTKQKPCITEKLPHQPTKQRGYVRMIIMTDNKKGK